MLAHDVIDARNRHIQSLGQGIRSHAEGNQIVLAKDLAGMYRPHSILKHCSFQIITSNVKRQGFGEFLRIERAGASPPFRT